MSAHVEHLTEQALELSEGERAEIAYRLLRSLDDAKEEGVEEAWEEEIARRVEEVKNGTASGIYAEEVFRETETDRTNTAISSPESGGRIRIAGW
jgi:putative addiction module component (TIGR02574 family)